MTTQQEVMPRELNLTAPPTIPQARTYVFKRQSELQEYSLEKGNRIRINIPRLQRTYLTKDSYLRFRLNLDIAELGTGANTQILCFDRCGAYGLFDRLEVYDYLGGTLLEQVQNIPALTVLQNDLNKNFTSMNGYLQATEGFNGSTIGFNDVNNITAEEFAEIKTNNTGMTLAAAKVAHTDQFVTKEFAIHLPSFLGAFSDRYVPLHNGFSIDLFLNSTDNALYTRETALIPGIVTFKQTPWLSNIELCCQVIELGDYAESLMMSNADPWVIPSRFYRYFTDQFDAKSWDASGKPAAAGSTAADVIPGVDYNANVSTNYRLDLNLNVVSLRNIFWGMRPLYNQEKIYRPSYGHRIRNYLENWNLQYGSSYLPEIAGISARSITVPQSKNGFFNKGGVLDSYNAPNVSGEADGFTQCFREFVKTSDNPGDVTINGPEYRTDTDSGKTGQNTNHDLSSRAPFQGTDGGTHGKFACGLNCRLSNKEAVCGLDTNGLNVCINATFNSTAATTTAGAINTTDVGPMVKAVIDCWAEHDGFVQIIPGVATTVTF